MDSALFFIIFIIILAFIFDFLNGFHDAANSIATIVSTQVLKPHHAVLWASFFNFIAFLFFKLKVATTIGQGLIDPHILEPSVIAAALIAAIIWNLLTWYYGLPSSSSHTLIGGLVGAAIMKSGISSLNFIGLSKVLISIIISPVMGFFLGILFIFSIARLFFHSTPKRVNFFFKKLQLISSALISLGHGGNDAQKTMGIIAALLFSGNFLGTEFYVPLWVIISCNLTMALGTLLGGWRIVSTMGMKITKLKPVHGFCAETAGAATLFLATSLGIPVSTTHTLTGSIIGVGTLQRFSATRWGVAQRIVWAWILTIPISAIIAATVYWIFFWLLKIR